MPPRNLSIEPQKRKRKVRQHTRGRMSADEKMVQYTKIAFGIIALLGMLKIIDLLITIANKP